LGELLGSVANHAFFFGELLVQQQWINPVETRFTGHERILANQIKNRGLILGALSYQSKRGLRTLLC
jgi:hypothetical protein